MSKKSNMTEFVETKGASVLENLIKVGFGLLMLAFFACAGLVCLVGLGGGQGWFGIARAVGIRAVFIALVFMGLGMAIDGYQSRQRGLD